MGTSNIQRPTPARRNHWMFDASRCVMWPNWTVNGSRWSSTTAASSSCRNANVTPLGACGCRAFENTGKKFTRRQRKAPGCRRNDEDGRYDYAAGVSRQEPGAAGREVIIRGHWPVIENGTHDRRDVTLGEAACRTANQPGAEVPASLRNPANGRSHRLRCPLPETR